MKNALLSIALVHLIVGTPCFAQDAQIVPIEKGEKAPFSGMLLSDDATAKMKAKIDTADEACKVKLTYADEICKADTAEKVGLIDSKLTLCSETSQAKITFRDEEIDDLAKRLHEAEKRQANGQLYFAGGVVAGIGLTVLAGWALGQVAN